jgi:hypothetical protein
MLSPLYIMLAGERFESIAYRITDAGQQPRAGVRAAILLSKGSDGLLPPKAAPGLLLRQGEVTGNPARDEAACAALKAGGGVINASALPEIARAYIERDVGPRAFAVCGSGVGTAPFVGPQG